MYHQETLRWTEYDVMDRIKAGASNVGVYRVAPTGQYQHNGATLPCTVSRQMKEHADNGGTMIFKMVDKKYVKRARDLKKLLRLHHPNILPMLHIFPLQSTVDHNLYVTVFVTPFCNIGELGVHMRGMPWYQKKKLMHGLWLALEFLSKEHGIVHGDIKPSNILVHTNGVSYNAFLSDIDDVNLCWDHRRPGPETLCFASATIFQDFCDPRRDQLALGLVTCDFLSNSDWCSKMESTLSAEVQRDLMGWTVGNFRPLSLDSFEKYFYLYREHIEGCFKQMGTWQRPLPDTIRDWDWQKVSSSMLDWLSSSGN